MQLSISSLAAGSCCCASPLFFCCHQWFCFSSLFTIALSLSLSLSILILCFVRPFLRFLLFFLYFSCDKLQLILPDLKLHILLSCFAGLDIMRCCFFFVQSSRHSPFLLLFFSRFLFFPIFLSYLQKKAK